MKTSQRNPVLDLLRAAAIVLVMLHHFRHLPGCPEWFGWFALRGYIGVDIFFVLSGYLIGGQLFRELERRGRIDLRRFWLRRWLRTLPTYYAMLGVMAALGAVPWSATPLYVVFLQNYVDPQGWLITWSLCIEEHFYLGLPLLVLLPWRFGARRAFVLGAGVALVVACPLLRYVAWREMTAGDLGYDWFLGELYSPTHLRLDGLTLGVLAAALQTWRSRLWRVLERRPGVCGAAGLVIFAVSTWLPALNGHTDAFTERMLLFPAVIGFLTAAFGAALMIVFAVAPGPGARLRVPGAEWVSEHAYTLYLTHLLAMEITIRLLPDGASFWLGLPAAFVVAAVFSAVVRRVVEVPYLRLRDKLCPRS